MFNTNDVFIPQLQDVKRLWDSIPNKDNRGILPVDNKDDMSVYLPNQELSNILFSQYHDWHIVCVLFDNLDSYESVTSKGKISKRINKLVREEGYPELSKESLDSLSAIIKQEKEKLLIAGVDITDEFNWRGGDYGDKGSCFFGGCYNECRIRLQDEGALAFRVYNDNSKGIGRVWMYENNHGLLLFNAYGIGLTSIADLLIKTLFPDNNGAIMSSEVKLTWPGGRINNNTAQLIHNVKQLPYDKYKLDIDGVYYD